MPALKPGTYVSVHFWDLHLEMGFFLMEGCEVCKDSLWFKPMISYILWLNPSLVEPAGDVFSMISYGFTYDLCRKANWGSQ